MVKEKTMKLRLQLRKILRKYKAPSLICNYPADDWDYCWSYARSVDKGEKNNCNCNGCEYNTTYKD